MQIWKKLSIGAFCSAVSFTALYYGALIALPNVIDLNKYKSNLFEAVEKETGFKISNEDISFQKSLTPYLKIHMYHTVVLYPDDEIFLKLKEVDLKVKILPLIFKKIVIKDAQFKRPIINITLYKDFSTSLEKYIDINKSVNTHGFRLDDFIYDTVCENYKIKFNDESLNKTFYLEGDELLLKDLKLNDKAHLSIKGAIFSDKKEYIKYDIDLVSALNSKNRQFTFSPFKPILESDVKADIYGHLKIDKNNNINGNLKISDLSIRLDDVIIPDNKADIIFKGQEAEIDSVIHTSKTDSATVKGKFAFGKKKHIDLNANAKNIKIENVIKIISEISEILNIQNPLCDIKAKGLVDADFNINSDFKKLKSSGKAQIINAVLFHKSLPYEVTGINAFVNLDNNKIVVEKANAKVNKTPVNMNGVINEDVSFKFNANSDNLSIVNIINLFDLNKHIPVSVIAGNLSFNSDISGILNKNYNLKANLNLNNLSIKDKKYNIPASAKSLVLNISGNEKKYNGEILCNDTNVKYLGQNFTAPEIKLLFDENKITVEEKTLSSPFTLKFSGLINDYKTKPAGYINFKGDINSSKLGEILKQNITLPYKAIGKIDSHGKLQFSPENLNIKAQLKANENNYISYAVIKELFKKPSILNIDCDLNENTINIKDLSLYENTGAEKPHGIIFVSGQILNLKDAVMKNIKLIIPEALTVSSNFFGGEEISLNANLLLNNTIQNPDIKGNIKILKYNIKKYLTSIKNADVSFSDNNIRIIAPDVVVNDSLFNIVADVVPSFNKDNIVVSNLDLHSMNLDLNSFFSMIQKECNPFAKSILTVKKGSATVNKFKVLDITAKDISGDLQIDKNIVKLSNISANAYSGSLEGKIDYDISHGTIDINMSGKGIDIKDSLYDLCKIQDNLAGRADFNAKISMLNGNYNEVLKSLNGNIQFSAYNGKMGTLGKFEYYLYAQNLLYHGILNATLNRIADALVRDNTAQYKNANGSILFQNGYILTEGIKTTGINMSLYLKGRHNLITNQANIDIYGRISDEVKYKLGSFGNTSISEMLNGQNENKGVTAAAVPQSITSKIPDLYNQKGSKSNTFKVNIYGNINSLNSINSFMWIIPDDYKQDNSDKLPDFSDMVQDL